MSQRTTMRIMQMDCPTEEALIRKRLEGLAGVDGVEFNLMQRLLTVDHAPGSLASIVAAVRAIGFSPELPDSAGQHAHLIEAPSKSAWPLAVAAAAAVVAEILAWFEAPLWMSAALAIFAVALSGPATYKKGFVAVFNGKLNINALMSIAVTGALALGQWPEAAMVMVLFAIAERIEAQSLNRARRAIEGLMEMAPATVTVWRAEDNAWLSQPASAVMPGMRVRVRPGERIGLDGVVASGRSTVDQAPITGESLPIEKTVGDVVYAGTINGAGALEYCVRAAFNDTTLARIIHAVQEAQGTKAPVQRFVDRFARVYTPIVCAIALAAALVPPLFFQYSWFDSIYRALVLLVIACPCALVISTPVAVVSGLAAAARHGILIKGGVYLEQGRKLAWLALDKTGTITHGKPVQTDFQALDESGEYQAEQCQRLTASLAQRSDHPVSRAISAHYLSDPGVSDLGTISPAALLKVDAFQALPGRGIQGSINGVQYWLGNHRLVEEFGMGSPKLEIDINQRERQGKTVIMLMRAQRVLALYAVADTIKPSSRQAIEDLHRLGVRTAMLSGDNAHTAQAVAAQAGIDRAYGNQLPDDKRLAVEHYSAQGLVGMVGDGINDAPALARADIGFAMGAMGADAAIETADVALMDDDLRKIPRFVRLSRATHAVLVQNITLALGIKLVFLVMAAAGLATMWMAVFADVGASLLVVGNSLRLLKGSQAGH